MSPQQKPPFRHWPLGLALLASLPVQGALAQQATRLEEVVVTAAKREQTLQEIPVAVSVVGAETIEQAQVLDIKDLQTLVPSLRVTQLQGSAQTNFIIRGFGNGANNAGIEPSVGVFIDGVYRSRVGSALADLPKLERVEVLRGPQSTLFGKNASAGVINVVTAKPDLTAFSGSIGATVGNYNQTIVRGDVTGPISDNLAFSLFGSRNERDGYFENIGLGNESNELDRWNFRGQLLWAPGDRLEMRWIVDAESIDEICCGVANLVDGPTGAIVRALGGDLVSNDPFAYENYLDFAPGNEIDTRGTSLQLDYLFENVLLTSITSYRTLDQFQFGDIDYTSARLVTPEGGNLSDTQIETFTQELRLTSLSEGPLQWMVGAFYFAEEVEIDGRFGYGDQFRAYSEFLTAALGAPGVLGQLEGLLGFPAGTFQATNQGFPSEVYGLDDETLSLFAQADYDLSDALTLTLGLNYTQSDKEASARLESTDVFSALPLAQISPALAALTPLQFLPPFLNYPNAVENGETNDDEMTYTARLSYEVSEYMSVYGGVSTGFKASSWNLSRDSRPFAQDIPALGAAGLLVPNLTAGTRFAGPEEATVYELGLKGEWSSFAVNVALFNQEIEGFQTNAFTGTGFNLTNAGKQSTDGLEVDLNWAPLDGLSIAFAATWLDPIYDDFPGGVGLGGAPADLSGEQPAGIPEFAANTNATYSFALGSARAYVRLEHVYEDEVQVVDQIPSSLASREVNMFNASAGLTFANGMELNLWGRNLNEDEYLLSAFPSVAQAGSFSAYPNQPRTYGLTFKYSFE
ncbi:TonB-dependent receptor [Pseudohaliea rubra]|uniref:TonB-dependent receptor n=1 Tax=Pseudohaliea rubra DSM 19751 TaxID=1265313 RepID=A0A095WVI4_9GAMM|nr:TonB-dependent receptor [Pseudohaliea rubra]KGE02649.1 TonB-dependent receptor [Pseudohaliea rubra DSM 19751]